VAPDQHRGRAHEQDRGELVTDAFRSSVVRKLREAGVEPGLAFVTTRFRSTMFAFLFVDKLSVGRSKGEVRTALASRLSG
jgi:hypothetical protein